MRTADGDADERTARDLEALDHPMRLPDVEALIVRGRARVAGRRRRRLGLIAAAAAFIATVSAAALIPSPVRTLVQGTLARARRQATGLAPHTAHGTTALLPSGIAFTPRGAIEVSFRRPQGASALRVTLADSGDVRVMSSRGSALYSLTSNGVNIENDGSGAMYDVRLPQTLARGTIRVAGRVVFVIDSTGVHTTVAPDANGVYHLSLAAGR